MSETRMDERLEPSKEAIETTDENGWLHRRCKGEVPENSKVIGGVLCRYWYEEEPEGVALLNSIHAHQQALREAQEEIGRLSNLLWGAKCIYCEQVLFRELQNQDIANDALKAHIAECPNHPLPKATQRALELEARVKELEGENKRLDATRDQYEDDLEQLHKYKDAEKARADRLQAEVERLKGEKQDAEESEMRISKKLQLSHENCACDYEQEGDLCMAHFPAKVALDKTIATQRTALDGLVAALRNLTAACITADANEELSEFIDGSRIDAANTALAQAKNALEGTQKETQS